MSNNKILKLPGNVYYEIVPSVDGCLSCAFDGNLGNCWLACNHYKCEIKDKHRYAYKHLPDLFDHYKNDEKYKAILDIVQNTTVNDFMSEEEKDMIICIIKSYLNNDDRDIVKDCRILCNKTFAVRLYNFISDIKSSDTEEINKLNESVSFAKELLNFQLKTCTDEREFEYFRNIGLCDKDNNVKLV